MEFGSRLDAAGPSVPAGGRVRQREAPPARSADRRSRGCLPDTAHRWTRPRLHGARFPSPPPEPPVTRLNRTFVQSMHPTSAQVFPRLWPEREMDWLPAQDARMLHSDTGVAEFGAVFASPHVAGGTHWVVTEHDPPRRVAFGAGNPADWRRTSRSIARTRMRTRPCSSRSAWTRRRCAAFAAGRCGRAPGARTSRASERSPAARAPESTPWPRRPTAPVRR